MDKVNILGFGAVGVHDVIGMVANMATISDFIKIQIYRKMWKLEIFFPKVVKYK